MQMTAAFIPAYGSPDKIRVRSTARPEPKKDEVLIRVMASGVTKADTMMRSGTPFLARLMVGFPRPRHPILGTGYAGIVTEVGADVTGFRVGDRVYGNAGLTFGANADYVTVKQSELIVPMPDGLSFEDAAPLTDGALTSLTFLQDIAHLQPGQRILIIGATGALGAAAVQIAKSMGAHVTGTARAANFGFLRDLGADEVIDHGIRNVRQMTGQYDVIYDTPGVAPFRSTRHLLTPKGLYMSPVLGCDLMFQMLMTRRSKGRRAVFSATGLRSVAQQRPLCDQINEMMTSGKLRGLVEHRFPLTDAARAHALVDAGHKRGNVVLTSAA